MEHDLERMITALTIILDTIDLSNYPEEYAQDLKEIIEHLRKEKETD